MKLRNRIIIILYIISFTVSIFVFASFMNGRSATVEYTAYTQGAYSGDKIFLAANVAGCGRIFRMDADGDVRAMFSSREADEERVELIDVNNEGVYAVLSTIQQADADDGTESSVFYRIIFMDHKLRLLSETETFLLGDEIISGFSAESGGLYLTTLAGDGSYASVYGINNSELKEPDSLTGSQVIVESLRKKVAPEGRFFSQARYGNGEMLARTDADAPFGYFRPDENVAYAVNHMRLSTGQIFSLYGNYILAYIAILLIWFVILFLLVRMFINRNRMFYFVAIAEAVLLVIVGVGVYTVTARTSEARKSEHSRFAVISMLSLADEAGITDYVDYSSQGFYDSEQYQSIRHALTDFVRREGNSDIFYDVLIVRLHDSVTVASASGRNLQSLTSIFGNAVDGISTSLFKGNRFSYEDMVIDNQRSRAIAVADDDTVPDYAIVGIINDTSDTAGVWVDNRGAIILFILSFAFGSVLILGIWYLLSRDMLILESALSDTALGKELPDRPVVMGRDVKDMWDSMTEISKRVEELQYSKLRILEAYYRFAPKNIEKFLQKDSIIDVRNGDRISLRGTVATINMPPGGIRDVRGYDRIIGSIGAFQKTHGCMLVGKAPDMSVIQMFMQDYEKNVTSFLTEVFATYNHGNGGSLSASLFYDKCSFGVAGTEEETTTYADAERKKLISAANRIVTGLHLGLVISEDIKERECVTGALRFIGYIGCGSRYGGIKLYEVLDAYPARVRSARLAVTDKFNEALGSFYEKDFYISRTLFSDILKETPDDDLVKWYVFESDRYLNESVDEETFRNLHV